MAYRFYPLPKPTALAATLALLLALWQMDAAAQVSVEMTAGITTEVTGSLGLGLDGHWTNNGAFTPGSSTLTLAGAGLQTITNAGGAFHNLTLNKAGGEAQLAGDLTVEGTMTLTSGDVDLNGQVITLGPSALLSETAGHTVKGMTGHLITTRTLNAPAGENVAGLGF